MWLKSLGQIAFLDMHIGFSFGLEVSISAFLVVNVICAGVVMKNSITAFAVYVWCGVGALRSLVETQSKRETL